MSTSKPGRIRVGVGGWTFEPWRNGTFYSEGLAHSRELAFASRALTSIEINGTYYSTFKPASWRKWADETPDDFVFAVKGSRYVTNRKQLATAGPSLERFLNQGLTELGAKLGPINWQLAPTKRFDTEDIAAFMALLPKSVGGIDLLHAIEVRHPSFDCDAFIELAKVHGIAVVFAQGAEFPQINAETGHFTYARLMVTQDNVTQGVPPRQITSIAKQAQAFTARGDVFLYFIAGAKERNPAAALALLDALASAPAMNAATTPTSISRRKTTTVRAKK